MRLTERLILRPPVPDDVPAHFAIHSDFATNIYNPSGPITRRVESDEIVAEWIAGWQRLGIGYWSVCLRDDAEKVVGFGGVTRKPLAGAERLNLYFRLAPTVWGRGLATEIGREALTSAGAEPVFALVRPANAPSIAVIQKLGMSSAGQVDDIPGAPPSLLFSTDGTIGPPTS